MDVDEQGVARLQSVLEENQGLANEVAAAFEAATKAIQEYQEAAASANAAPSSGGGENQSGGKNAGADKDNGSEGGRDLTGYKRSGGRQPDDTDDGTPGAKADGFWISENSLQDLTRLGLSGSLEGDNAPAMPSTAKDLTLRNLETTYLGQVTRDTANARKELIDWQDAGLESNPADREGYTELQSSIQEILSEPVAEAREYMQQAMDAEDAGEDGTGYIDKITEILQEPLEQVRQLVEEFYASDDDQDDSPEGGEDGGTEGTLDLETARADLETFREEAAEPVELSANASGMTAAVKKAYNSIKSLFSTPIVITAKVKTVGGTGGDGGDDDNGGDDKDNDNGGNPVKMSTGGRFTSPTDVQVAEDGDAEYIIPVKKENRAVPLLRQLLEELSPAARESLVDNSEFRIKNSELSGGEEGMASAGGAGAVLASYPAAGNAAVTQVTQNYRNVSAPVSIEVHASGADGERIGQKIYDTAERYLLRTLQSSLQGG